MLKKFVLDTSVLIYDHDALFKFEENEIIIPSTVIEEINVLKEESSGRGESARRVLEILEELIEVRPLKEGVKLSEVKQSSFIYDRIRCKDTLIRKNYSISNSEIKSLLRMEDKDYSIIACALNNNAILISRDRGMRIIASDFVKVENYEADMIKTKEIYKGYRKEVVPEDTINSLYAKKEIDDNFNLYPNEFVVFTSSSNPSHVGIGIKKKNKIISCDFSNINKSINKLKPINLEQKMFLYLLLDNDIKCVTATGVSGKGKSLLSIDYAISSIYRETYNKLLYTKSTISVDKREDLGFYKGGVEEKLRPHLQPLYSSIEFLYKSKRYSNKEEKKNTESQVEELIEEDILEFYPLANIRGMSILNKVVMLDEAQNVTNHMMKSLVTRVSDSSKLIVVGDIEQIDDRNLNKYNNGLSHLIEAGKTEEFVGHICMDIDNGSIRGALANFGASSL